MPRHAARPVHRTSGWLDIRSSVDAGHEPAGHVEDGGCQSGGQARRIPQMLGRVKHVGRTPNKFEHWIAPNIREMHEQFAEGGSGFPADEVR